MKNFKIILITTIIFMCATFFACTKQTTQSQLPPATQIGAGTLGCLINGTVYKTSGPFNADHMTCHTQNYINPSSLSGPLDIIAEMCEEGSFSNLEIYLNTEPKIGKFFIGGLNSQGEINCDSKGGAYYYKTDSNSIGNLIITKVTDHIVSGTFSGNLTNKTYNKTATITEGRFDMPR
jgi:hypothetical protein